jgi:hypothetical protein
MKLYGTILYLDKNEVKELLDYLYSKEKYQRFYNLDLLFRLNLYDNTLDLRSYEKNVIFHYLNFNGLKKEYSQYKGKLNKVVIVDSFIEDENLLFD